MGGVCSKSGTKAAKSKGAAGQDGAAAAAAAPHAEDAVSVNSNPKGRVGDHTAAAAAGANDSTFTISSNGGSDGAPLDLSRNAHPDDRSHTENSKGSGGAAPVRDSTAPRTAGSSSASNVIITSAATAAADPASPLPTGHGYNAYFPLDHDAGMKLGAGKYNGVGTSPFSSVRSPELVSLASSAAPAHGRDARKGRSVPPPYRPSGAPVSFTDDDTSMLETASSAFATPREVHEGAGGGFPSNASIVSHGSMMSQRPHGYEYYNSSAAEADYCPTPSPASLSPLPSMGAATSPSRSVQVPSHASSHAASPQPLSRWPLNTMTVTNVRTNKQQPAASSLGAPGTPMTSRSSFAGSDRFQSCRSLTDASAVPSSSSPPLARHLSPSSGHTFYTCRSAATPASEATSLTPPPPRRGLAGSLPRGRPQSGTPPLPPCSPLSTPRGQPPSLPRQASLRSSRGDGVASDAFFSVPPSASDVFLDLPSAAASTPAELFVDPATNASAMRGSPARSAAAALFTGTSTSSTPLQRGAATAASQTSASSTSSFFADSVNASSTASGWMDTPALTKPKPRNGSSGTPADAAGMAAASRRANSRATPRVRKPYYTREDFPPNPNPPPRVRQILAARSAAAASHEPFDRSDSGQTPSTAVADAVPVITTTTASLIEVSAMEGTQVSLSTASETSTRKPGAVTGRPTQPYVEPAAAAADAAAARSELSASLKANAAVTAPEASSSPMKLSASTHSFSTAASSYRHDYVVPEAASSPPAAADTATALPNSRRRRLSGSGNDNSGGGGSGPQTGARRRRSSSPVVGSGHSGRAAPVMANPNPWVPNSTRLNATSTHVDPAGTPPHAATVRAGGAGVGPRRSSQGRRSSMPQASGGRRSAAGAPATAAAAAAAHHPQPRPRSPRAGARATAADTHGTASPSGQRTSRTGAPRVTRRVLYPASSTTASHGVAKVESVVEYALSLGDATSSEAAAVSGGFDSGARSGTGAAAAAADEGGHHNGTALAKPVPVSRRYPNADGDAHDTPHCTTAHPDGGEVIAGRRSISSDGSDVYRASPDMSGAMTTSSAADSAFLQPFTEAQLAEQLQHAQPGERVGAATPPRHEAGVPRSHGAAPPMLLGDDAGFLNPEAESSRDSVGDARGGSSDDDGSEDDVDLRDAAQGDADDVRDRAAIAAEFVDAVRSSTEGDMHAAVSVSTASGDDAVTPHSTRSPGNAGRSPM